VVVRPTERVERALPPFEEIRDDVAELWVEERAPELARERLDALALALREAADEDPGDEDPGDEDAGEEDPGEDPAAGGDEDPEPEDAPFEPFQIDRETFVATAEAAGYSVRRRDWFDRTRRNDDPDMDLPAHKFMQSEFALYQLEAGTVAEPQSDRLGEHVFLFHAEGSRPADISQMRASDYQGSFGLAARSAQAATADFGEAAFSYEALQARYGVTLQSDEELDEFTDEDTGLEGEPAEGEPVEGDDAP
jgi:hypothetical protein